MRGLGDVVFDELGPDPKPERKARRRQRRRVAYKRVGLVLAVLMIPVGYSYVNALVGPGTDSFQARTVEWARDHYLSSVVDRVEQYWYAHHQAKVGGAPDPREVAPQLAATAVTTVTA